MEKYVCPDILRNAIYVGEKISWNQLFSHFFSKNVDFTEKHLFFRKIDDVRSSFQSTVCVYNKVDLFSLILR